MFAREPGLKPTLGESLTRTCRRNGPRGDGATAVFDAAHFYNAQSSIVFRFLFQRHCRVRCCGAANRRGRNCGRPARELCSCEWRNIVSMRRCDSCNAMNFAQGDAFQTNYQRDSSFPASGGAFKQIGPMSRKIYEDLWKAGTIKSSVGEV